MCYLQNVWSLSLAWRMPPPYYIHASRYSALLTLIGYDYTPLTLVIWLDVSIAPCVAV